MKTAILLWCAMFALQAPQDTSATQLDLKRTDGEVVTGTLVSMENDKVKLRLQILGGSMVVTHKLSDYEPASAFRILCAANPPTDFDSQFAAAKKAADLGLLEQAGQRGRAAIAAAKGAADFEQKRTAVRAWAADALEKMVRDHVAAGELDRARHCMKLLSTRLADQRSEEQLGALTEMVDGLEGKHLQEQADKRQKGRDAKQAEANQKQLKPIQQEMVKGDKAYQEAVRKSRSTVASSNLCETAVGHYKKGYLALQALVEKSPDDEQLASEAASLGKEIHDNGIRAALHAANVRCMQTDFKEAMEWTQRVLAFDPGNAEAKAMMQTITAAEADASDSWRWGWRITDNRGRGQER